MEIRTGSSDSNSSRHKSSNFESVQWRSNESQYDQEEQQKWSPDQPMRRRHNKEDQFESEEAEIISTAPTSKSKQGQAAGIPEAEVVNNRIARRGKEERGATDPSPWRS
ncbi:hypothetical protein TNCV_4595241 [Trichonephila clavipes]|uniref:Uncharacterized protein n=1 Tax=Trichonephila clavipes TaxID=2585209 RepID=A0A8X7BKL0_TRICX|nr:hypothetical protein TNCV_4595241 [Trichonephila clavipes]